MQAQTSTLHSSPRRLHGLAIGIAVAIFGIIGANVIVLTQLHQNTLLDVQTALQRQGLVLSESAQHTFQSVDAILIDIINSVRRQGVNDSGTLEQMLGDKATHDLLNSKVSALSHVDTVMLVSADGAIVNAARQWPPAAVDLADRDYVRIFKETSSTQAFISSPVQNRVTGNWTVFIARGLFNSENKFFGIVVGGISLQYFEQFYRSTVLGDGYAVSLMRRDGTLLVRYPQAGHIGGVTPLSSLKALESSQSTFNRAISPIDGQARIVSAHRVGDYPVAILVTQEEKAAFAAWRKMAIAMGLVAAILMLLVFIAAVLIARSWRQQEHLDAVRAQIIESGKTQALAESELTRQRELALQSKRFNAAMENMSQGLCMFDASQQLIICNAQYAKLYGLTAEQTKPGTTFRNILEHRVRAGLVPDEYNIYINDQIDKINSDTPHHITTQLNDERYVSIVHQPMDGGGWVATHEDVTQKLRAEQELAEAKQFLDSIVSNIPNAIVVKDATTRKVVLTNAVYEATFGFSKAELIGKTAFDIYGREDAERMDKSDTESLRDATGININDYEMITPLGGVQNLTTKRIVVRDARGSAKYLIIVIEDVTDRKKSEQQIYFMAKHDALTGLANRTAIVQEMEDAVARQRRRGDPFSVLLLDLDRFKQVNDTLGHPAGDALLREVAARLKAFMRETDVLARLGGDEFAIIQAGGADQRGAAHALAGRIVEVLTSPFNIDGNTVNVGASIGIALAPEHASDPQDLLKMADLALYCAKSAGRNCYRFYGAEMSIAASARQEIENELRHAITNDELVLHYQPIIDSKTGKICAAEALIRWRHPTKGMIPPDQFIPLAEETGLITQIGEWVLHTACTVAANWPPDVKVAVNLSPVQFRKTNLPDVVMYALAQSGLPPERLELEITETALIEAAAECLPVLRQFRNLGIAVALDDFGTGYSSLAQLTMFQFSKIKVDKSFTKNMIKSVECAAIISAVLTLAKSLNMATTAEGVETVEQYRILRAAGVTSLQGYLFKRPCPASEINFSGTYNARELENAA